MSAFVGKRELALIEQVTNSLWSFLALRLLYSHYEEREIALVGITIAFSYSCSGLLRSKFVHPLYEDFADSNERKRYDFLPIFKSILPKYLICFTLVFFTYIELNDGTQERFQFELTALVCSIILLDFQRSFLQLNSEYVLAISTNILSIFVLLNLVLLTGANAVSSFEAEAIDLWIISNLIASGIIIFNNKRTSNKVDTILSPFSDVTANFTKISNLSSLESIFSRVFQLLGSAILLRISEQTAAQLTVALFIYSTIPFSIINGLSPYYLRNRKVFKGNLSFTKYFSLIIFGMVVFPCIALVSPQLLVVIFGSNFQISQIVVLFVLLMVIQKALDSAKSLDFMINVSPIVYFVTKTIILVNVYLTSPILLGLGFPLIATLILLTVIVGQIKIVKG